MIPDPRQLAYELHRQKWTAAQLVRAVEGEIIPPSKVRNLLPGSHAQSDGQAIHFTSHPDGVLAEVVFAHSRGGGAAIGRDRDHAAQLAAEIVAAHEEGR